MTKAKAEGWDRRYWVNTVSRDHVRAGVAGGFTQADHGKDTRLKHLSKGDLIVFYSPKTSFRGGEPLQTFTALGEVTDDAPYRVEMASDFRPWRRKINFHESAEVMIRPLLDVLDFIPDKQRWGYPFWRGLFEVGEDDFRTIAEAMSVNLFQFKTTGS